MQVLKKIISVLNFSEIDVISPVTNYVTFILILLQEIDFDETYC